MTAETGRLEGINALVTGGGSGIGQAIASRFAREGAAVVIAGRRAERLETAAAELGALVTPAAADITREEDVDHLFRVTVERFGRLHVLVNCAGAFAGGVVDDLELEDWQRVFDVNVTGMFLCARAAFRHMRPAGGGRIINVGSLAAMRARTGSTAYASSKHAVWGLTQALALDGRNDTIAVSCLNPGNTEVERRQAGRPMTGDSGEPEPVMQPDEVAQVAALMASYPPEVNLLEATILPTEQRFLGRG